MKTLCTLARLAVALLILPGCAGLSHFEQVVATDVASPQGKAVLAAAVQSGLAITRAVLQSTSPAGAIAAIPADFAAANSLAATVEAFSTLPTNSVKLSQALAAGAGDGSAVTNQLAPAIASLIVTTQQQNPTIPPDTIAQKVAEGVFVAANPKP